MAAGKQLASTFNELSAQLSTISKPGTRTVRSAHRHRREKCEDYANQIAQLNGQIKLAEEADQQPNDMLDRRDLLLDKLSALANVTVTEQPDHTDTVSFGEAAKPLVEGTTVNWPQALTEAAGGRLGALLGLTGPQRRAEQPCRRDSTASPKRSRAPSTNISKTPFFSGATAATLAVAVETLRSPGLRRPKSPGGNEVAQAIAALRGGAAEQGYATLVEQVGSDVQRRKGRTDQPADDGHGDQRPAPERLGRLAR